MRRKVAALLFFAPLHLAGLTSLSFSAPLRKTTRQTSTIVEGWNQFESKRGSFSLQSHLVAFLAIGFVVVSASVCTERRKRVLHFSVSLCLCVKAFVFLRASASPRQIRSARYTVIKTP